MTTRYLTPLSLVAALYLAAMGLAQDPISFWQWDNFELYLPSIWKAQSILFSGHLPLWNESQHLGEATMSLAQFGVFYPPYMVCYAAARSMGLGAPGMVNLIFFFHLAGLVTGLAFLFSKWELERLQTLSGIIIASSLGMLVSSAAHWIPSLGVIAWVPWQMGALIEVRKSNLALRPILLLAGFTGMQLLTGHVQYSTYSLVFISLITLIFFVLTGARKQHYSQALWGTGLGILLAAPSLVPALCQVSSTSRSGGYSYEEFTYLGIHPRALIGLLTPLASEASGLWGERSVMMYLGPWVLPALLLVLVSFRRSLVKNPSTAFFISVLSASFLYLIFSLNVGGGLYGLTHFIPVWNSFKNRARFGLFFSLGLVVAATYALNALAKWDLRRHRHLILGWILFTSAMSWGVGTPFSARLVVFLLAVSSPIALLFLHDRRARWALVTLSGMASVLMLTFTFDLTLKRFPDSSQIPTATTLDVDRDYRVFPVWADSDRHPGPDLATLQMGFFQLATVGGYRSLIGSTSALAPLHYLEWVPSDPWGTLPQEAYRTLLGSHLLRTFNVKYLVSHREDLVAESLIKNQGRGKIHKEFSSARLWRLPDPLPRAYFATSRQPYSKAAITDGLIRNRAAPTTVYLSDDSIPPVTTLAPAEVVTMDWKKEGGAELTLRAPQGGILVLSESYDRNWRAKTSEGQTLRVLRANGALTAIIIPPETTQITFYYSAREVVWGLAIATISLLSTLLIFFRIIPMHLSKEPS